MSLFDFILHRHDRLGDEDKLHDAMFVTSFVNEAKMGLKQQFARKNSLKSVFGPFLMCTAR